METSRAFAGFLLFTVLLSGCGGGSNNSTGSPPAVTPPPVTPPTVQNEYVGGIWYGSSGHDRWGFIDGKVSEDGRAYFLQVEIGSDSGFVQLLWGQMVSSGSQVRADFNVYGGRVFGQSESEEFTGTARLTGTIAGRGDDRRLEGSLDFTGSDGASASTSVDAYYERELYESSSSIDVISGSYQDSGLYSYAWLDISRRDGSMFLQDPESGCILNGQISTIDTSFNLYDVVFSHTGCVGPMSDLNGVTFHGLASRTWDDEIEIYAGAHVNGAPYGLALWFD